MLILGLNAHHGDSAACLVRDGQLIAAAEEERFRRIKHWAGLPTEAVRYCLREGEADLVDVDHIAINRQPTINCLRRLLFVIRHRPDWRFLRDRLRNRGAVNSISDELRQTLKSGPLRAQTHHIEHHLAHMASAYMVSSFDRAVCVSVDGFGDFASTAWGVGKGRSMSIDGRIYFPHSLGIFYTAISQHLGFPHFGDEYKVMGLAPYGQPRFLSQMRELVHVLSDGTYRLGLQYFRHHTENVPYHWHECAPEMGRLSTPALDVLLGGPRNEHEPLEQAHRDLARSAQEMFEEALFALLNALHKRYQCPNLALAGGCAMNSVANGKIYSRSPFKRLYLPPAASDAGGAIGAAFVVWNQLSAKLSSPADNGDSQPTPPDDRRNGNRSHYFMSHAYVGPEFDREHIRDFLRCREEELACENCSVESIADAQSLCARTARAIADGLVVGWFQGRMEWGPRALGNRSILCDPRRADMKQVLNAKIKRRESFRPFAPSILREHVRRWFEQDEDVPFMMQVFQVRQEKRQFVPATTHVDGSGRLQTVHRETNPLYHQLISEFYSLTGVPMVLNTSFNENEPVVCRPEEAFDCFLRTQMDVLVIDRFYIQRQRLCAA